MLHTLSVFPRFAADEVPGIAAATRLLLRARALVRGMAAGERSGARAGAGVEFHDFAVYSPGADVRRIDPLASARTGKLLLRTYREDARRTVHVLLDRSPSMGLAPRGAHPGKWDAARTLALAAVLAATRGGDRGRVWTFADGGATRLTGRGRGGTTQAGRLALALAVLSTAVPGTGTDLDAALRSVAGRCSRGDAVLVVTDLLSPGGSPLATLRALRARRHPVVVLHLLGAEDRAPPPGPVRLVPVEGGAAVVLDGDAARVAYTAALGRWVDGWRGSFADAGVRSVRVDADLPLAAALAAALAPSRDGARETAARGHGARKLV